MLADGETHDRDGAPVSEKTPRRLLRALVLELDWCNTASPENSCEGRRGAGGNVSASLLVKGDFSGVEGLTRPLALRLKNGASTFNATKSAFLLDGFDGRERSMVPHAVLHAAPLRGRWRG